MHDARYAFEIFAWFLLAALLYFFYTGAGGLSTIPILLISAVAIAVMIVGPILLRKLPDQTSTKEPIGAKIVRFARLPVLLAAVVVLIAQ